MVGLSPAGASNGYHLLDRWEMRASSALFGIIGIIAALVSGAYAWALVGLGIVTVVATMIVVWTCKPDSGARWLIPAAASGAFGWFLASLVGAPPAVAFALMLPFAVGMARYRPWLPWILAALLTLGAGMIAGSASAVGASPVWQGGVLGLLLLGSEMVVFLGIDVGAKLNARMELQREEQKELAITRERLRFANQLHDVQGHTLLAIKLKAEYARRILGVKPDTARAELEEIESLVAEASSQTRQIAHDYRSMNLAAELANMEHLLTAAGITVTVSREQAADPAWETLFATLVREATTNLLRHANSSWVTVAITSSMITIDNDGASATNTATPANSGTGLASLGERFTALGGQLRWDLKAPVFTVSGSTEATIGEFRP
ncbi:sensor histidine kinase [Arthrobacter rhombi]|uniref:sensor histidine kinase n=1 Tax=Arthrobacter rhombi TaxID=71253 RepID=UPI003FCF1624